MTHAAYCYTAATRLALKVHSWRQIPEHDAFAAIYLMRAKHPSRWSLTSPQACMVA
jgi:hypothetical protein